MLPGKKSSLWNCHDIYKKLLDPYTQTVRAEYLIPILKKQFQQCKRYHQLLSLAIIKFSGLPIVSTNPSMPSEGSTLLRKIMTKIKADLRPSDMIFYDDSQEITFLLPNTKKDNTKKLLNRIKKNLKQIYVYSNPLVFSGGYAEFPADSATFIKLQECAVKALNIANKSTENRIIGHFTERRKYKRIPLQIEVRYAAPGVRKHLTCSRNLSEGGIMISGMPDLPQGDNIKLTFMLPDTAGTKISVTARSIWNKICQKTGKIDIGLCFTYINSAAKKKIRECIQGAIPPVVYQ